MKNFRFLLISPLFLFICLFTNSQAHVIGEKFGGGVIFYITPDALHGLIAESQNLVSGKCDWYHALNEVSRPSNHSVAGQNFTDWRLPTAHEGLLLQKQIKVVPALLDGSYWTFTDREDNKPHSFWIGRGQSVFEDNRKTDRMHVRPIRSF